MSRFYFRNWHGLNEKEPTVSRHTLKSGTDNNAGSPLLDITSLEYLFAQVCDIHLLLLSVCCLFSLSKWRNLCFFCLQCRPSMNLWIMWKSQSLMWKTIVSKTRAWAWLYSTCHTSQCKRGWTCRKLLEKLGNCYTMLCSYLIVLIIEMF